MFWLCRKLQIIRRDRCGRRFVPAEFPFVWKELLDIQEACTRHSLKYVGQVFLGVNMETPAGLDKGHQNGSGLTTGSGTCEQVVLHT